jgi:Trypsin-like peptidase domain
VQQPKIITPYRPSYTSLLLQTETKGVLASSASGFVVARGGRAFLVSNWHVFSGKNPLTGSSTHCPDTVRFKYWHEGATAKLVEHCAPLLRDGEPLWLEHPEHGQKVDVAALPLAEFDPGNVSTYDPWRSRYVDIGVGDDVAVIGFPFGVNIDSLAVWTRASIATEFDADYNDLPAYLVDARTREGQSGSPVIFFRSGAYFDRYGAIVMPNVEREFVRRPAPALPPDEPKPHWRFTEEFLGVYSGRVNADSDLGFVWRPSALCKIIEWRKKAAW